MSSVLPIEIVTCFNSTMTAVMTPITEMTQCQNKMEYRKF